MTAHGLCIKDGVLFRCVCVRLTSDAVKLAGDVVCGAGFCPLKEHVLNEVRDAGLMRQFMAGAGIDIYAGRCRAVKVDVFKQYCHPVCELCNFDHGRLQKNKVGHLLPTLYFT
ncbi:hypothetical protein SDC9_83735 [bioreactor metagenome]|uniref:Uncharacterized protein n=1 Tax=bioreactor metagenome TaxID=1076179 RepID=A0A644Z8Z9_9ZZZZ